MNRLSFVFAFLFISLPLWAQDETEDSEAVVDSLYREDQFYFGLTYNLLTAVPEGVRIQGFSGGVRMGFLRDMPINKTRTIAIAIGGGLGLNRYGSTLSVNDQNGSTQFAVLGDEADFDSNRFSTVHLEAPLEFRWRSSSPSQYRFYRVHAGVNFSYTVSNRATFVEQGQRVKTTNIEAFNKFQAQATLLFGYNTINFFAAYQITPLFDGNTLGGEEVGFKPLNLGILFYFL
ncbi:MAG: outer membrane beta-barrel protein [Gilvibacter sp.]